MGTMLEIGLLPDEVIVSNFLAGRAKKAGAMAGGEVMSAVLQSTYPLGPHAGRGRAYESGASECFCELTPPRLLSRGPEVTSVVLQSSYPLEPRTRGVSPQSR